MNYPGSRSWKGGMRWGIGILVMMLARFGAVGQQAGSVARMVIWQPKPGMVRDFEESYKRHLEWHRGKNDSFRWYGWNIVSGDCVGSFADGTFFHGWSDFDHAVAPAEDSANNALNVEPYADVRASMIFEMIPSLSRLDDRNLTTPLLGFYYFSLSPGSGAEFESIFAVAFRNAGIDTIEHAVFRPVNGTTEYMLLLPAQKTSEFGVQAAFVAKLLDSVRQKTQAVPILERLRVETGRYRDDLSYVPGQAAK